MKDTFYFSHDYNARVDEKIKRLIRAHGMKGYGIFWSIVEDLYNNANALPADYDGIAYDLRTEPETIKSVISDFELFIIEDGSFGSTSVSRRLEDRNKKSESARQSAYKRWGKKKGKANAKRTHTEGNAIKESIEKEKKGKKTAEESKKIEYETILKLFRLNCDKLPKVIKLTDERKKHITARINEYGYESIEEVLKKAGKSEFLAGKNDRNWKADIDWIFNPTNFLKILEGKYNNKVNDLTQRQPIQSITVATNETVFK